MNELQIFLRRAFNDIRIGIGSEFDKNFERQAFFNQAWERRHSPINASKPLLINTGTLRRSIKSTSTADSITFTSDLPYSGIHNAGGIIVVTPKMHRFFWAKYIETSGAFGRKKNGEKRQDKRNAKLTTESEFWKCMALMKVGSQIKIPKRQFIGLSPEVVRLVQTIFEKNLNEYFAQNPPIKK